MKRQNKTKGSEDATVGIQDNESRIIVFNHQFILSSGIEKANYLMNQKESIECYLCEDERKGLMLDEEHFLFDKGRILYMNNSYCEDNDEDRGENSQVRNEDEEEEILAIPTSASLPVISSFPSITSSCQCTNTPSPSLPPLWQWPQRPLLLRAAPNMTILGIRYVSSSTYLSPSSLRSCTGEMCPSCAFLPINNGHELPGRSLVIDFQTKYFEGSLLLRIRHCSPFIKCKQDESVGGYFAKFNRQYQAVIRGRFLQPVPMAKCFTGHIFSRPLANLPSKMVRTPAMKIVSYFAPRLDANFGHSNSVHVPRFLSPLLSTPQCIISSNSVRSSSFAGQELEQAFSEPIDSTSILHELVSKSTKLPSNITLSCRKKLGDSYIGNNTFSLEREYTFEFLQHLIHYPTFTISLGSRTKVQLATMLNGQPIHIMAGFGDNKDRGLVAGTLWDFELWNEACYEDAVSFEQNANLRKTSSNNIF